MNIQNVAQISISVRDLARATAFYEETLQLKKLFTVGTMAFFDCQGMRLMLAKPENKDADHPSSILYFRVADIHESASELETKKVELLAAPHCVAKMPAQEIWMCFFKDPEGNTLALTSEIPAA